MLTFLALTLQLLPLLIQVGEDVLPVINKSLAVYNSGNPEPTDADWQELRATEARLTAIIDQRAATEGA